MHPQAWEYLKRVVPIYNESKPIVLEIGSYNVNGSVRELFSQALHYQGVDMRAGPGVDTVMDAHNIITNKTYDIVVTTETLEHDPRPKHLLDVAFTALKPGGTLILTAASTGRPPHSVNGDQNFQEGEYYGNVSPEQLAEWLSKWEDVQIEYNPNPGDVYATARRPNDPPRY